MQRKATALTATILSGATESDAINLRDHALAGFIIPAAFTGTTIAFKVSNSRTGTFVDLYDSTNALVQITVAINRAYGLSGTDADALAPWDWVKLVSGGAEGANRSIIVAKK